MPFYGENILKKFTNKANLISHVKMLINLPYIIKIVTLVIRHNFPGAIRNLEWRSTIKKEMPCRKRLCLFPRLVDKFVIVYFC